MNRVSQQALAAVRGGYDLHTHAAPTHFKKELTDYALLEQADALGLAGVLIKCHYEPTALRAALINLSGRYHAEAYGALSLNWPVGGLNPYAVEAACKAGARTIWMPTRDAAHNMEFGYMHEDFLQRPGIRICGEGGALCKNVLEILEIVRSRGAFLATGHLSPKESALLCRTGRELGCNMILTHPDWVRTRIPLPLQCELAQCGVLVEKAWSNVVMGYVGMDEIAQSIRTLGAQNVFLVTDSGSGLDIFAQALLERGFSFAQVRRMIQENPARIVNA